MNFLVTIKGDNSLGRLGLGDMQARPIPTELTTIKGKVSRLVCSAFARHWFLQVNNVIYGVGSNVNAELGVLGGENMLLPTVVDMFQGKDYIAAVGEHLTVALLNIKPGDDTAITDENYDDMALNTLFT
jgi:hypothetical protein